MDTECIVIDNRSTDDTSRVVAAFRRDAPIAVRYVYEPQLGSSYARNRAVAEARGDFLLFIDDDALAEPDWAIALLAEMERRRLDVACGMVLPQWGGPLPRWLGPALYPHLAVHDEAGLTAPATAGLVRVENYFSANVGFRRHTFELFGNFREDLGVVGNNPMSGEDTELFTRIAACGGALGFTTRARVHHMIPVERMRRQYLRRKSYAFGYGSAVAGGRTHNHLDKLGRNALRMLLALMCGRFERAVFHELECANFVGYWRGRLHLNRTRGLR